MHTEKLNRFININLIIDGTQCVYIIHMNIQIMHVFTSIHAYMHTYTHTYTHKHTHAHIHTPASYIHMFTSRKHIYIDKHTNTLIHIHTHLCIYIYLFIYSVESFHPIQLFRWSNFRWNTCNWNSSKYHRIRSRHLYITYPEHIFFIGVPKFGLTHCQTRHHLLYKICLDIFLWEPFLYIMNTSIFFKDIVFFSSIGILRTHNLLLTSPKHCHWAT